MAYHILLALGGLAAVPVATAELALTAAPPPFAVMAAINAAATGEGSLAACSVADDHLFSCADQIDGPLTDINDILPCACCSSGAAFGDVYGQCANFISRSLTHLSSSYTLFYGMDVFCSSEPSNFCQTAGGEDNLSASGSSLPTDVIASLTRSGSSEETGPVVAPGDTHPLCQSLGYTILDCAEATPELLNSPVESLAGCFCYETDSSGSSTYAGDEIGAWATTCADWARSARSFEALTIATPFTTMCDDYSATALDGPIIPTFTRITGGDDDDDDDSSNDDDDTVGSDDDETTVESTPEPSPSGNGSDESTGDNGNSAAAIRISVAAGVLALFAAVVAI